MSTQVPLQPGLFYHVYNRGINGANLFREARNYRYFLERYAHHIMPVAKTYAYCLMPNHFHLLVAMRSASLQGAHASEPLPFHRYSQAFANLFNRHYTELGLYGSASASKSKVVKSAGQVHDLITNRM